MTTRECIIKRINQLCYERHLSINALANQAGVSPSTIKNITNGLSRNPGVVTIKIICDGLNISLFDFFNTEDFKSLEQEII